MSSAPFVNYVVERLTTHARRRWSMKPSSNSSLNPSTTLSGLAPNTCGAMTPHKTQRKKTHPSLVALLLLLLLLRLLSRSSLHN
jgi:hypothetical protein